MPKFVTVPVFEKDNRIRIEFSLTRAILRYWAVFSEPHLQRWDVDLHAWSSK